MRVSLQNFTDETKKRITSPRSVVAMRRRAIRFSDIKPLPYSNFQRDYPEPAIADLHYKRYEEKRKSLLEDVKAEFNKVCELGISREEFLFLGSPPEIKKLVNEDLSSSGKVVSNEIDKSSLAYMSKVRALEAMQKRQAREAQHKAEMEERMKQKEERARLAEEAKFKAMARQQEQREIARIAELEKQQRIEEEKRRYKEKKEKERKEMEAKEAAKREQIQARQEAHKKQLEEEARRRNQEQEEKNRMMEQRAREYQRQMEEANENRRRMMEQKEAERMQQLAEERERKRRENEERQREAERKLNEVNRQRAKDDAERRASTLMKLQQGEERLAKRKEEERLRLEEEHKLAEEKEKARLELLAKQREVAEKKRMETLQREKEREERAREQAEARRLEEKLKLEEEKLRVKDRIENAKRLWEQTEYSKRVALTKLEARMDNALEHQRQKLGQKDLMLHLNIKAEDLAAISDSQTARNRSNSIEYEEKPKRARSYGTSRKATKKMVASNSDDHALTNEEAEAVLATLHKSLHDTTKLDRPRPVITQDDIVQLRQKHNAEILQRINYEQAKEEERRAELARTSDPTERRRLTTLFTRERLAATDEMNELKERHDKEMRRLLTGTYRK